MGFDFRIGSEQVQSFNSTNEVNVANVDKDEENLPDKSSLTVSKDGDTVDISAEAKSLLQQAQSEKTDQAKAGASGSSGSEETSKEDEMIEKLKEQIEKLKEEIAKLKQDPEKNKDQISAKENELMQLQGQLTTLLKQQAENSGTSMGGGTRAEGFKSSLT